jgi:deoxyribose-phosphate aldolase
MEYRPRDIAKMIDLSLLRPNLSDEDVIKGCDIAKKYDVATVCCGPSQVPLVKKCLAGSNVIVSTVLGFPHGYSTTAAKIFEAEEALREGAVELDMVLNIGKVLSHDFDYVEREIAAVAKVAHEGGGILKVILENYYLTDELKVKACMVAEKAGADFVKTSTGFAAGGATFTDLRLMRKTVSAKVQVKAAGGIRELDTALLVRECGGTRFGCTATEKIMEECFRRVGNRG